MRVKLLTLRFAPSLGGFDDRPLADFISDKEVLAIREHFFVVHDLPHIACLVTYQDPVLPTATLRPGPAGPAGASRANVAGPCNALTGEERVLFGTLREWRATRARKDGVPPYVILTNRELAAVVQARPATPTGLAALDGIGPGKVERYGADIISRLHPAPAAESTAPATSQVQGAVT